MKRRNREINIFNLSMLDVIFGALGAFLILMLVLFPFYKKESIDFQKENQQIQKQLSEAIQAKAAAEEAAVEAHKKIQELEERLGLSLNEKNILFIMDVSGSMEEENRMTEVTMGIKMLIATMKPDHKVDVMIFPNEPAQASYGFHWGQLREVSEDNKYETYRFLSALQPSGGTPTRAALQTAFQHPGYRDVRAIVLFSDGMPVDASGKPSRAEIDGILSMVRQQNVGHIKINTIGVGPAFRDRTSREDAVVFMRTLAEQNDGFFVGF